jgi:Glyoxalase/Bleomycin resistance protein/Dioxygenase superfamily
LTAALQPPFHFGIATPDVDELMAALGPSLGLTWVDLPRPPVEHRTPTGPTRPSSRVVWSSEGPLHVELVRSESGTIYRPDAGTHLHHVGYWVEDLAVSIEAAEGDGWNLEVTMPGPDGRPAAFAYLSRPGDLWIELVDSAQRPVLQAILSGESGPAKPWVIGLP